jgi:hypothetical protein
MDSMAKPTLGHDTTYVTRVGFITGSTHKLNILRLAHFHISFNEWGLDIFLGTFRPLCIKLTLGTPNARTGVGERAFDMSHDGEISWQCGFRLQNEKISATLDLQYEFGNIHSTDL